MKYVLYLSEDGSGRIIAVASEIYAEEDQVVVETIPEGDICDYLYIDGEYIYDPIVKVVDEGYDTVVNTSSFVGIVAVENGGVPESTTSDNGKFLRVVDGAASWQTVQNAEEVFV